jgi:predicted nucleotidyltransferase/SAM-dependent methyltransferase
MILPTVGERMALAQQAAALLYARGATRVWLFGSLAKGRVQDKRSDIDLAVEGLPERVRDVALGELRGRFRSRIDVIGIESTPAGLRSSVFRNRHLLPRVGPGLEERPDSEPGGPPRCELQPRLYQQRLAAVLEELKARGARRVIDLGCGGGWLIEVLARDGSFEAATGVDMAEEVLRDTRTRLRRVLTIAEMQRVQLFVTLLTFRDPRLLGFDAAVATEVIEHMDAPRFAAFESVLFGYVRPPTIVITTPNQEYNVKWRIQFEHGLRHERHQWEWTRRQFHDWASRRASASGYDVRVLPIGPIDAVVGPPTQMAVFTTLTGPRV